MWQPLPFLTLLLLGVACEGSQAAPSAASRRLLDAQLSQDSTFTTQEGNGTDEARLIPGSIVNGQLLGPPLEGVAADEACSAACRAEPRCRWFAYCGLPQGGCKAANGAQLLAYRQCQLLTGNCSLHISVTHLDGITSGFPVRLDGVMQISGFVEFPAQGIEGGDMQCPESLAPDTCSFRSPLAAAAMCIRIPACRAVVVFPNGTDGCSAEPVALLKTAGLNPVDGFVSDRVYTLQVAKYQSEESSFWLTAGEGNVLLPSASELSAGDAALSAPDAWKGCIWGGNAIYDGQVVDTLDGVASPEACCRACHARQARCNVWNWCDPAVAVKGTCFYQDTTLTRETVVLNASQCQLRYQELAAPEVGTPPVLLAKGPAVPFAAGAPISVWAPEQPGFQRFIGRSLFAWGQYPCEGSLRPQAGECLLQAPVEQLASECAANDTCVALLYKPGGFINGTAQLASLAYFKSDANPASHGRIAEHQPLDSSALPSSMLSAGLSAALPPGSSVASTAHAVSSGRMHAHAAKNSSSNSGPDVLEELMGHVATRDAVQQACSLPRSTDSSEPGLWMAERLPSRLHEWMVDPENIEYLRWPNGKLMELGQGASAHVYKALFNGELVACKEIDLEQSKEMQEAFVTEATRLHALRHPNIIAFFGICVANGKGIVIMEFAEGRDLHAALQVKASGSDQRLFGWQRRGRRVAFELAKAVNYLHSKDVIHFDLKSQNVLLTANGAVRLGDVGFSKLKEKTFITHVPLVGTFAWIAPEVLLGRAQVDQAADIFSLGVVMWEIVTGERPQRGSLRMPRVPEECPQEVSDLIMQCLSEEPCERPTAAQLLKTLSGMLERSKTAAHSAHSAHRAAAATDAGAQEQVSPPVSPSAGWPETPR
ncbi:serine threonine- kinase receptor R831 [Chlorella sorokiniana]|uniref:non-specific serine/threonine protein kinase n=1 Tax=Chlorella sorokiniana TaxID=3076 RepID=A0A2P6TMR9_CHLSO|nr:serine threonine- kinase receptor R831 [Chlorella sorokiniana]|eukprot:PRW45638.1 serine threonine- kinase receptor R831 [Chlorella sorokiniana]